MKNIPRKDGSGKGVRVNRGRGGCTTTKKIGQGRNISKEFEEKLNIEGLEEIW